MTIKKRQGDDMNINKLDDLIALLKANDPIAKREEEKKKAKQKCVMKWVIAVIAIVAAIAGIAYAVYRYFTPDYLEDFEDDFEDDFDDDFFEDEGEN